MTEKESELPEAKYECISCKAKISAEVLLLSPEIKCPMCGYRVLRKVRPPIVTKLKTN
jgi:DNA-directed RNA polymerase subunit RPC12/RpoP